MRLFWHGSKAGDQYVSPFDRRTITVPKEVVFGDNDATVYWGRSHEANFVPRVSCIALLSPVQADPVPSRPFFHTRRLSVLEWLVAIDPRVADSRARFVHK